MRDAVFGVPLVVTRTPRQHSVERVEQVVHRPRYDYVVVDANNCRYDDHAVTDSCNRYDTCSRVATYVKSRVGFLPGRNLFLPCHWQKVGRN